MMGIVRAADGWIGINCLTGQHWLDVCAMLGLPEYGEQQIAIMLGGPERGEFFEKAQPWLVGADRGRDRRIEPGDADSRLRPVNDGATVVRLPPVSSIAGSSSRQVAHDWSFRRPGAPFRLSKTPVLPPRPAPRAGFSGRPSTMHRARIV